MSQMSSKLEQVLEFLVNGENDKAQELLHDTIVEKAREIHEEIVNTQEATDTEAETKESTEETTEAKSEETTEAKSDDDAENNGNLGIGWRLGATRIDIRTDGRR